MNDLGCHASSLAVLFPWRTAVSNIFKKVATERRPVTASCQTERLGASARQVKRAKKHIRKIKKIFPAIVSLKNVCKFHWYSGNGVSHYSTCCNERRLAECKLVSASWFQTTPHPIPSFWSTSCFAAHSFKFHWEELEFLWEFSYVSFMRSILWYPCMRNSRLFFQMIILGTSFKINSSALPLVS